MRAALFSIATMFACAGVALAVDRSAFVDAEGVLRWTDDNREVAVFGVNYYTPFHVEYRETKARGYDAKDVIRRDVAHLRRLGLDAMRLHCFDSEISDKAGNLVDNDHLDLLDYLIAECASNGIYTVLTPISGWGGEDLCRTNSFRWGRTRIDLATNAVLIAAQMCYEEAFARHVNRYTRRRYGDDPAVLAFELVNEPDYPKDWTDAQVAGYANALFEGLRRSGTKKPVFYNALWGKHRKGAVPLMKVEGVAGGCYCTGLRAGHALATPQLCTVRAGEFAPDPRLAGKAKIVYEFDAADVTGAYMYPAMARLFRSQGVQSATQFQYESTPIADDNRAYMTHYLHLVYTPEKALSLAIAAEAFRRLPRGCAFAPDAEGMVFPPFRVDVAQNLSEMVTEHDLLYTATPTPPPAPEKLRRVWGCGGSSVVASTGNGCYFLDRISEGVWRLQLYPSIMPCADPHTGSRAVKTVVLADHPTLTIHLPDLGDSYTCARHADNAHVGTAKAGALTLAPGDYVLMRTLGRAVAPRPPRTPPSYSPPMWWAPPPHPVDPNRRRWPPTREETIAAARARATTPEAWNFFDEPLARKCQVWAQDFKAQNTSQWRCGLRGWLFPALFPAADFGTPSTLVFRGRSTTGRPEPVEITFRTIQGRPWGTVITLPPGGGEVRVPLAAFRYFAHHHNAPPFEKGWCLEIGDITGMTLCIGRWLYPDAIDRPHGVTLDFIGIADRANQK